LSKIDIKSAAGARFLSVRRWQAGPEWRPRAHKHPFCEIVVVVQGMERTVVAGNALLCQPGHILFYPPDCIHEERQAGNVPLEFLCLEFEWSTLPADMPHLSHDRQGRIQEIVRWMLAEEQARYAGKMEYLDMGTKMLASELLRLVESHPADIVVAVHDYIQQYLDSPISLDDLAECVQMNKFHFVRIFRARSGMTPIQYVRQIRLDAAYHFVRETNLPLREIAPRVGFANEYHLSRLLKARYGRGARELRRPNEFGVEGVAEPK
jgi:AraC-like DNA-binding protein